MARAARAIARACRGTDTARALRRGAAVGIARRSERRADFAAVAQQPGRTFLRGVADVGACECADGRMSASGDRRLERAAPFARARTGFAAERRAATACNPC